MLPEPFRRRQHQAGIGGRVDLGAAGVLDGDLEIARDRDVADQLGLGQPADAGEFYGDAVDKRIRQRAQERVDAVDGLVEHQRPVAGAAYGEVLLIGRAGLFERVVDRPRRQQELPRLGRAPAAIGVAEDHRIGRDGVAHGFEPGDVFAHVEPDLDLQPAVALRDVFLRPRRHGVGRFLGERTIERQARAFGAAGHCRERQAAAPAGEIPERHVDRRLRVRMAFEQQVHAPVERLDAGRRLAESFGASSRIAARAPSAKAGS